MAKHIIFLVHGMGVHPPGWSHDTQQLLRKLYGQYPGLNFVPFDQQFEFQEILYDQLFEEKRSQWRSDAGAVIQALKAEGLDDNAAQRLAELAQGPTGDDFFATHVLDVLLYRFIPTIAEQVRVSVARQWLERVSAGASDSTLRWSIIAHSLGTAVTHDTLHALYNTPIHGTTTAPLNPAATRPQVLAMIANVSRVLQTQAKAYESLVRPSIDKSLGLCDHFINARHQQDLFTVPKQFDPDDLWPDLATRTAGRYKPVVTSAYAAPNIHGLDHYLANPKVHVPLFRALTAHFMIEDDEARASFEAYHRRTLQGQFDELRQRLKSIAPREQASWQEIIGAWTQFQRLIG